MSDEPSLRSIDNKLGEFGGFMLNQKEINQSLSDAVKEIATAVTKSESMQVELNGLSARLSDQSHELKDIEKRTSKNETQLLLKTIGRVAASTWPTVLSKKCPSFIGRERLCATRPTDSH